MTAVTLDTNVLGSGLVGIRVPTSTPGEILRRWRAGDFTLLLSDHILGELEDLLADPYFASRLTRAERAAALQLFRTETLITPLTVPVQGVATHPEDDLVLATALSGKAPTWSPATPSCSGSVPTRA